MDSERADMLGELIGTGRKIKKVDDDIVTYKIKIVEDMVSKGVDRKMAEEMAETMAQMVSQQAGKKATPKITDQGLLEMENMQKNLITKDRKLQAAGGLTTMLGE
jgi:anaerobic ribonucleoside-triphosphate reductase